jgi:DNA-binding transcriptional MocR family regulator
VGRGTFIRGHEPEDVERGPIDLSINVLMPDREVLALEPRMFQRRVLPWTQLLGYVRTPGHMRHRQAMAAWLGRQGLLVAPDRIVLTAGAQHAMVTAFMATAKPGDTILVEELTYSGMRNLAQHLHLKLRGVAMDAEGLKPEALETACRASRARILYCMPRLQNPTSAVMSERRRKQVAAIAERYKLTVVEDDTYGFLSPERVPLTTLIPDRAIFVTSLSKSLFPGIRLGAVVAPPALTERVSGVVWATMIMTSPIGADLLSSWLEDGTAARIAEWKRHEVQARQAIAARVLDGHRYQTHPCSPHLWVQLPARWTSDAFVAEMRSRGVLIGAASEFRVSDSDSRAVRVCLGTPRTRAGLETGLMRLAEVLSERMPAARVVV